MYYQRTHKAFDAPEGIGNITKEFVYVPYLRRLLLVSHSASIGPDADLVLSTDENELAEARKVYNGTRRSGSVRFHEVKNFDYNSRSIEEFVGNLQALDKLQERVHRDLSDLVKAAKR